MKPDEAIGIIKGLIKPVEISYKSSPLLDKPPYPAVEALTLAISALEKQERETREKPFPFVVGQPAEIFCDGKWEKGKIVAGYRFEDGVVTIETEDGRKIWCGQDRTDIYRPYQEEEA